MAPIFNNWFKLNKPNKSLLICSPYFKKDAFERISEYYNLSDENCNIDIEVLIRGKLEDFIKGSSDISALESLLRLKCVNVNKVRRLTNLHMKAYLVDRNSLLIGSGNCTQRGLFAHNTSGNVEAAITTDDPSVISEFEKYYSDVVNNSESLETFYDSICEGYVKYIDEFQPDIGNEILSLINKGEAKSKYKFAELKVETDDIKYNSLNISVNAIPQFSNFEVGCYEVVNTLFKYNNVGLTFSELGYYLQGPGKNDIAYKKYGENHAKLAELLDFVAITETRPRRVYLTLLGESYYKASSQRKLQILKTQVFRMEIVKDIIIRHTSQDFDLRNYLRMFLSEKTTTRRLPNVKKLFYFLKENGLNEVDSVIEKIN